MSDKLGMLSLGSTAAYDTRWSFSDSLLHILMVC